MAASIIILRIIAEINNKNISDNEDNISENSSK
jgi:hypothetical protein